MALTLDPATKVISVPQADLTLVSGTLYELDTDAFRKDVFDLLSSETYIWLPDAFIHNTAVTVAGVTFARTIEFINGFSVAFENLAYSVRLAGSNNNIFDVENGILVQNLVQVIAQNSAGLVAVDAGGGAGSGATVSDIWNADSALYDDDETMGGLLNNTVKKPITGEQPVFEGTWMPIELVDVDQLVTEDDLNSWLGGHVRERLGLSDWTGSSKHARQYALNRCLESLRRRNPPLSFGELSFPQELNDAIKYGAAEHLYQLAMTGPGDVHDAQRKIWEEKFDNEMNGLMVTVAGGEGIPAGSVSAERR